MNVGIRSKLSLCQLLTLLSRDNIVLLLQKHGLPAEDIEYQGSGYTVDEGLRHAILGASPSKIGDLLQEVARTQGSIRSMVSPRYRFEERWLDLTLCLQLDNYELVQDERVEEMKSFLPTEPMIEGAEPVEDDLSKELASSGLAETSEIVRLVRESAEAFFRGEYNACLNNARVALETVARSIGQNRSAIHPTDANMKRWGEVVTYLRTSEFITVEQERGLAGIYGFVSPGSHVPIGFSESEFARLGRAMALSCTYFLVKRWNGG